MPSSVWPLFWDSNRNTEVLKAYVADGETYGLMQLHLPLSMAGLPWIKEIKKGIGDTFMSGVITTSCEHVGEEIARPLVLLKQTQAERGLAGDNVCKCVCVLQSGRANKKV